MAILNRLFNIRLIQAGHMCLPVIFCLLWSGANEALGQAAKDYDVKAVFLFNFAQFVDWPEFALPEATSSFVIGILGEDPFGKSLDEVVRGENVRDHKLVVKRFQRVEDVGVCHILFVNQRDPRELGRILAALRGRPILTVGETDGFAVSGGMIRFITSQNKIRLRINPKAAQDAGLTISSKLLKAAEDIVEIEDRK